MYDNPLSGRIANSIVQLMVINGNSRWLLGLRPRPHQGGCSSPLDPRLLPGSMLRIDMAWPPGKYRFQRPLLKSSSGSKGCCGTGFRTLLPASNEYMTSGKIKYAERKTALRYRYGTMWTRKMAYRCGHAPSSKCLLCGDEDGGHHTASGCPALKRMYINRHNKVGRLIMTRVLRGRKGAFVIQMDLGSTENCAEDGIMAHQSRNIPWELLPRGLKEAVQQAQGTTDKRPDGMLYKPKNGNNPAEYWIIEVKICRDSDPTGQQSKADYQHQVLIDKIKDIDPTAKVWYYPLLVGVAGTIYNSTTMNLQALGIKGQALKQCISEVHTAAVKSLHSIYTTKRKLEKPKEPQWHRRNYKKVS